MDPAAFGRALSFIDFANANHWYDGIFTDLDGAALQAGAKVEISLEKLQSFAECLGQDARFYYGLDTANSRSLAFIKAAGHTFGRGRVFTKPIQQIRHDLTPEDTIPNTRIVHTDARGNFVYIPKCNFDVEIAVDALRLLDRYDTICLFSGDADFAALLRYLKRKNKHVILVKGGRITKSLGELADLKIEAADIRPYISYQKARAQH
ncbi:MAG TPA: NYN domain-containing protein [Rhizomicrobium sp.]|nr:NYN domain-containing protein [Rhizomicrobium sp.]